MRPTAALGMMVKGMGGLVFGNHDQSAEDDGGVEQLLERISNGVLSEDRRAAMAELLTVVGESRQAQLAFGAMGFPVAMSIFREERDDVEMVKGALEALTNALSTEGAEDDHGQVSPGLINSELFAREQGVVALLLSLLEEEDFYVRYYVLQILTILLSVSPVRLQEEVLATPQGITRLMDMMLEREVIRNEALLLLTHLTRAAKEIQKIVVFEGAFERLFAIIKEEGGSDGGIVVQDCLELLNNLLRNNPSNQVFLRETMGLQNVSSLLKIRKGSGDGFTEQKYVNLLCALETVALLLAGGTSLDPAKDSNVVANQTMLAQNGLLDNLLALSVEGRISAAAIRCLALKCIGDLVNGHSNNRDLLASTMLRDEPDSEPAVVCILRLLLRTPNLNECIAAEYVFKCFCEGNTEGQTMLASTITPLPQSSKRVDDDRHISFGSMLVQALVGIDGRNDLEASCRAASVLSHVLKDNVSCKERVLRIPLEIPASRNAYTMSEYLLPRCMKYLAAAASMERLNGGGGGGGGGGGSEIGAVWLQPVVLRLLVTWLAECPAAVASFLDTQTHLPFLIQLISDTSSSTTAVHVAGLAAVLLGECIVYNNSSNSSSSNLQDASKILDVINQRVGLTNYIAKWEEMQQSALFISASSASRLPKPLTRSTAAAVAAGDGFIAASSVDKHQHLHEFGRSSSSPSSSDADADAAAEPAVTLFYDAPFVQFINKLQPIVRERIVDLFAHPNRTDRIEADAFQAKQGESDAEYAARLREVSRRQAQEIEDLLARNCALAEDLVGNSKEGSSNRDWSLQRSGALKSEIDELKQQVEIAEKKAIEAEKEMQLYKQLANKYEAELQGLSDAYNLLEQANYEMEAQVRNYGDGDGDGDGDGVRIAAAREEGREQAQKESEAELNDLLVCLGQEESKVEKLRARLEELGEDVDVLLHEGGEDDDAD